MDITGTAAVVTGAASGLGAATAALLAQRGATVYGLDLEKSIVDVTPPAGVTLLAADVTEEARRGAHDLDLFHTVLNDLAQYGIRVVTIAPGIVDTPMMAGFSDEVRAGLGAGVPFPQRLGQPGEYARPVTMVLEHDYLNGETIRMDGALRMTPR